MRALIAEGPVLSSFRLLCNAWLFLAGGVLLFVCSILSFEEDISLSIKC